MQACAQTFVVAVLLLLMIFFSFCVMLLENSSQKKIKNKKKDKEESQGMGSYADIHTHKSVNYGPFEWIVEWMTDQWIKGLNGAIHSFEYRWIEAERNGPWDCWQLPRPAPPWNNPDCRGKKEDEKKYKYSIPTTPSSLILTKSTHPSSTPTNLPTNQQAYKQPTTTTIYHHHQY